MLRSTFSPLRRACVAVVVSSAFMACGDEASTGPVCERPPCDESPDTGPPKPNPGTPPTPNRAPYGRFETRLEAAFDGEVDQNVSASARSPIHDDVWDDPDALVEFDCVFALTRATAKAPTDGAFFADAFGGQLVGRLDLIARERGRAYPTVLASRVVGEAKDVVWEASDFRLYEDYVAYGVAFVSENGFRGFAQLAELELEGTCLTPLAEMAWSADAWFCGDVECHAAENPGGVERRNVECRADDTYVATPGLCAGEAPAAVRNACTLRCDHRLVFIGDRPYTTAFGSGWLHDGRYRPLAGPIPSSVTMQAAVSSIEGKPCSRLTEDERTYYTAISCTSSPPPSDEPHYCAFRCE